MSIAGAHYKVTELKLSTEAENISNTIHKHRIYTMESIYIKFGKKNKTDEFLIDDER